MSTHHVLHDPQGLDTADLPLDRATHEQYARLALSWSSEPDVSADEVAAVGLLLAGAARVVADEVRTRAARLSEDDGRRALAELILQEADGRLVQPCTRVHQVQSRARLVRSLYERLDRLEVAAAAVDGAAAAAP
jgi:hypothetical protein